LVFLAGLTLPVSFAMRFFYRHVESLSFINRRTQWQPLPQIA
jgi:hypothetical protein